jgi:PAS domain S-box-containing protein
LKRQSHREAIGKADETTARIGNASRSIQVDKVFQHPAKITRLMLENANDAIYVVQNGMLKFVNAKTIEIFAYPRRSLTSRPFIEYVHKDDRPAIRERHQRRLRGEDIPNMYPFRIVDGHGGVKWIEVNNVLIAWRGEPATLCFMRDITEKKKAEDALKQSERLLADIIDFLPDATFAIDVSGAVIAWNRAIERLTGIPADAIIGRRGYEHTRALYGKSQPMLIDKVLNASLSCVEKHISLDEQNSLLAETEVQRDNRNVTFWCKAGLIYDYHETIIGAIESLRDMTELKQAESELKARTRSLKETNTALKVLLKQREQDNIEIEERFLLNIKKLVLPYVWNLKTAKLEPNLSSDVDLIENHLNELISPFLTKLTSKYSQLTPREIQVASLIKDGLTTKDIAKLLRLSTNTIDIYRQNIRKKSNLRNRKINLQTFFSSLV